MDDHKPVKQLAYPFPLRKHYVAQIVVPRDLTQEEANRLCSFVISLAKPDEVQHG